MYCIHTVVTYNGIRNENRPNENAEKWAQKIGESVSVFVRSILCVYELKKNLNKTVVLSFWCLCDDLYLCNRMLRSAGTVYFLVTRKHPRGRKHSMQIMVVIPNLQNSSISMQYVQFEQGALSWKSPLV